MTEAIVEHVGLVKKVLAGRITIAVQLEGCSSCGHGSACGMARLARRQNTADMEFPAPPGLRVGELVTLRMPENRTGVFALIGYLLPALALVAGAAIGNILGGNDTNTALGALIGFFAALLSAHWLSQRLPIPSILPTPSLHPFIEEFHYER